MLFTGSMFLLQVLMHTLHILAKLSTSNYLYMVSIILVVCDFREVALEEQSGMQCLHE